MKTLTKSNFLKFWQCPKALWLSTYRKDLIPEVDENRQAVFEAGFEVEEYAYRLFPEGEKVSEEENSDIGEEIGKTKELIKNKKPVVFQPVFSAGNLFCRCDVIEYDEEKEVWNVYEVKSSTKTQKIHYYDLAFQKVCLERAGLKVGNLSVIHVDNSYVKQGGIDPEKLLKVEDVTEKVEKVEEEVKEMIKQAFEVLEKDGEPEARILRQCDNPYECDFKHYCLSEVEVDSIYAISSALGAKKLDQLLDREILKVQDIPEEMLDKKKLWLHKEAVVNDSIHKEKENINKELSKLEYPLYFLDYETYGPAIPMFDGYKPYQRIVFQYSLHVQREPGGEVEHYEFLAKEGEDPACKLSRSLARQVGEKGSFIVWYAAFEKGCNREMGERCPEFRDFYRDVNNRIYDLMEIFKKSYYVHKDFKASASLKYVLPVMAPELSYKDLDIQEGGTASNRWAKMIQSKTSEEEKEKIYQDLLKYCELDTLAMVRILEELRGGV
ncbi:MAG: DUF2779 domain-containing protein [Candidatus Moraniibacteriota bacterium]